MRGLIEAVLEAGIDDEAYAALAGRLSQGFDAVTTWTMDHHPDQTVTIGSAYQMDEQIKPYNQYFYKHDLWRQRSVHARLNEATNCERLVSQSEMDNSEMYNDFIKPSGKNVFHCLGIMLTTPYQDMMTGVGIQRVRSQKAFDDDDEKRLQQVQPYLSRLAASRWRSAVLEQRAAMAEWAAARNEDAVLMVARSGTVVWRNDAAARDLGEPFVIGMDKVLRRRDARADISLQRMIEDATAPFPLGRSAIVEDSVSGRRWAVAVDPADAAPERRLAVVCIRDLHRRAQRQAEAATSSFSLSPAEALLAGALLAGRSVEAHAAQRGVGVSTIRTQLSTILAKSATTRQADFVALAAALPT